MRLTIAVLSVLSSICPSDAGYFSWMTGKDENVVVTEKPEQPSNLGCFLCTQLLSVTKHRVGLSQNQLRNAFYEKCRLLPAVFKEQCFTFVETSLPEIYFALNYDFSTKDICLRLQLCDENSPFATGGPPPEETRRLPIASTTVRPTIRVRTTTPTTTTTTRSTTTTTLDEIAVESWIGTRKTEPKDIDDRIGHSNGSKPVPERQDEKRLTCAFCERMLENAKTYAVTTKADITVFANTACAKLPKGPGGDQCYQLADKRIADLAKFVDQQVVEALWCAELHQC